MKIAYLLLAAGASKRFGSVKQIVPIYSQHKAVTALHSTLLINKAIDNLLKISADCYQDIYIAVGGNKEQVVPKIEFASNIEGSQLRPNAINILTVEHWQQGIGQSISESVNTITQKNYSHICMVLADLVALTYDDLLNLKQASLNAPDNIIAACYQQIVGVPAIFPKWCFNNLCALRGDIGAKRLIKQYAEKTVTVAIPNAAIDIDTPADLHRWSTSTQ